MAIGAGPGRMEALGFGSLGWEQLQTRWVCLASSGLAQAGEKKHQSKTKSCIRQVAMHLKAFGNNKQSTCAKNTHVPMGQNPNRTPSDPNPH